MTLSQRDKRALALMAMALAVGGIVYLALPQPSSVAASAVPENTEAIERRLVRMRQIATALPAHEATLKQVSADLSDRERGLIQGDTAAQAQASLIEIARRSGKTEQIDIRGGEFSAPRVFGDYGLVYATVTFDCHIEQLINFLADLSQQPELIVPSEERIVSGNPKEKIVSVRMVLAGAVAKKLVPEKKGLAAF
jgi:hypothetical protein